MPDTFTCQWINRLDQLGATTMEVIITHDQEIIPQSRIGRKWRIAPEVIDQDFLAAESELLVNQVVDTWNAEQEIV